MDRMSCSKTITDVINVSSFLTVVIVASVKELKLDIVKKMKFCPIADNMAVIWMYGIMSGWFLQYSAPAFPSPVRTAKQNANIPPQKFTKNINS